jgi:hypothetical protein
LLANAKLIEELEFWQRLKTALQLSPKRLLAPLADNDELDLMRQILEVEEHVAVPPMTSEGVRAKPLRESSRTTFLRSYTLRPSILEFLALLV